MLVCLFSFHALARSFLLLHGALWIFLSPFYSASQRPPLLHVTHTILLSDDDGVLSFFLRCTYKHRSGVSFSFGHGKYTFS
jgi:hypothetical protein